MAPEATWFSWLLESDRFCLAARQKFLPSNWWERNFTRIHTHFLVQKYVVGYLVSWFCYKVISCVWGGGHFWHYIFSFEKNALIWHFWSSANNVRAETAIAGILGRFLKHCYWLRELCKFTWRRLIENKTLLLCAQRKQGKACQLIPMVQNHKLYLEYANEG